MNDILKSLLLLALTVPLGGLGGLAGKGAAAGLRALLTRLAGRKAIGGLAERLAAKTFVPAIKGAEGALKGTLAGKLVGDRAAVTGSSVFRRLLGGAEIPATATAEKVAASGGVPEFLGRTAGYLSPFAFSGGEHPETAAIQQQAQLNAMLRQLEKRGPQEQGIDINALMALLQQQQQNRSLV